MFIIKVTVKENSFQVKPSKRLVATMLNPDKILNIRSYKQYIISAIKWDKVSIWHPLTFSDVPQGSILVIRDIRYVLAIWDRFIPSMFRIKIEKCKVVPIN